jgi:hypothetical protein
MIHLVISSIIPSVQKFQEVLMFGKALEFKGIIKSGVHTQLLSCAGPSFGKALHLGPYPP